MDIGSAVPDSGLWTVCGSIRPETAGTKRGLGQGRSLWRGVMQMASIRGSCYHRPPNRPRDQLMPRHPSPGSRMDVHGRYPGRITHPRSRRCSMRFLAVGLSLLVIACEGPVGPQGPAGPQRPAGQDGATGPQGPQGPEGPHKGRRVNSSTGETFLRSTALRRLPAYSDDVVQ